MRAPPARACRNHGVDRCGCRRSVCRCVGGERQCRHFQRRHQQAVRPLQEPGPCPDRRRAGQCLPRADSGTRRRRQGQQADHHAERHRLLLHVEAAISSPRASGRAPRSPISGTSTTLSGARVGRVQGEQLVARPLGGDPWSGVDSAAIRSLAAKIAPQIAASLVGRQRSPASGRLRATTRPWNGPERRRQAAGGCGDGACPRVAKGPVTAMVSPVSGAPGDGHEIPDRRHQEAALCQGR